jgi:uncharacterized membrane protein YphA (DoxX/SURF4 family)
MRICGSRHGYSGHVTLASKLRRAPLRIVSGAFILNSGIGKFGTPDDAAKHIHGMAAGAFPVCQKVPPKAFVKALAVGETALGAALLLPIVPTAVAGAGLTAFAGSLLGLYWNTPGMHEEGSPRPTVQGTAIAKDVWMFGIGTSLVIDSVVTPVHNSSLRGRTRTKAVVKAQAKAARKAAKRAAKKASKQADRVRSTAEAVLPS